MSDEPEVKMITIEGLREHSIKGNFDQIVSDLREAFMQDLTVEQACSYAGIVKDTYYNWCKLSDEFANSMARAMTITPINAKKNIANLIKEGDPELSKWYLERREKSLYANRSELTGAEGKDLDTGRQPLQEISNTLKKAFEPDGQDPDKKASS